MKEKYHAIKNSLGGYDIIRESEYNTQGDILCTGTLQECQDAIANDKEKGE